MKTMKIKNKRGSHVGVVVSFAIFVTFLFFVYAILEPTMTTERDKQYILDYLKLNLVDNVSSDMTTMTVYIEEPVPKNCVKINSVVGEIPEHDELLFKNQDDETLIYEISGDGFRIEVGYGFNGFLKIYHAEGLNSSLGTPECTGNTPINQIEPTFIKTYSQIFESKIGDINESYYTNYEGLKSELGIPEGTEFSFYLWDSERNEIFKAENQVPPTTKSVYVEEIPIQYVDEQGNIKFGFLVIKVW